MTTRTKRVRVSARGLTAYGAEELLTGEANRYVGYMNYDGFSGDRDAMRAEWRQYRDELLAFWCCDGPVTWPTRPWLCATPCPGTRPWAWWEFEAPEPIGDDEDETDYLRRLDLLLPGEEAAIARWIEAQVARRQEMRDYLAGPGPFNVVQSAGDRRREVRRLDREIGELRLALEAAVKSEDER